MNITTVLTFHVYLNENGSISLSFIEDKTNLYVIAFNKNSTAPHLGTPAPSMKHGTPRARPPERASTPATPPGRTRPAAANYTIA